VDDTVGGDELAREREELGAALAIEALEGADALQLEGGSAALPCAPVARR
jgi:hypothetical protein